MLPRTRLLYAFAVFVALAAALSAGLSIVIYRNVAADAARVNRAGLVRGHIQRAIKLGLSPEPAGTAVAEAEAILIEEERTFLDEAEAGEILARIRMEWDLIKPSLFEKRPEAAAEILERSERLWVLSVRLVEAVQHSSEKRAGLGRYLALSLVVVLAFAAAVFLLIRSYVAGRLEAASIRDALTGLYNRRFFEFAVGHEALRASRYPGEFSVISFDLDHFKEVNDSRGHAEGDRVLRAVASSATSRIRRSDLLFRLGGDEFLVFLPGTDSTEAMGIAEKLRTAIASLGEAGRGVTASLGVASFLPGDDAASILGRADRALYRAKLGGRNRVAGEDPEAALGEAAAAPEL